VMVTVLVAVSITETLLELKFAYIGKGSVRREGNTGGVLPHWDRGDHTVSGGVDDRNGRRLIDGQRSHTAPVLVT